VKDSAPLLTPLGGYRSQIHSPLVNVLMLPLDKRTTTAIIKPTTKTISFVSEAIMAIFETVFALLFPFILNSNRG
jgi:hypothetical protein